MPYPRVCADGGINDIAPKNSLPSIASAISLGANEVALTLRETKDGVIVCSNEDVDSVTYSELNKKDLPAKVNGIKVPTLEEVLKKSASQTIFNFIVEKTSLIGIENLLRRFDCENHCYFTFTDIDQLKTFKGNYPKYDVCLKGNIEDAIELGVNKIQILVNDLTEDLIKTAKENAIKINCEGVTVESAKCLIEKGVDTLITENCLEVSQIII